MKLVSRRIAIVLFFVFAIQLQSAFADTLRLRIEDVFHHVGIVVTDNGPSGLDQEPAPGVIKFEGGPIGSFLFNFSIASSTPTSAGDGSNLYLLTGNFQVSHFAWLRITLEDLTYGAGPDGLSLLSGAVRSEFVNVQGGPGPAGSFGFAQSWVNPGNAVPDLGPDAAGFLDPAWAFTVPAGSVQAFADPGSVFGVDPLENSGSAPFTKSGQYSLFTQINAAFTGPGVLVLDALASTAPVPEPSSLFLLSAGLALLAYRGANKP